MGSPMIDRYDRVAEGYERCWAPVLHPGGARLLERIEAAEPGLAGGGECDVLDVGCGTGNQLLDAVRRWPAAQLNGLDASQGMLAVTRRRLESVPGAATRVLLTCADAARIPIGDASFDVVMSSFVVQLVPDRAAVLREMRRVLRPAGLVAVAGWLEERDELPFEPEDAFELSLARLDIERPPNEECRAGDFASVRTAAAELRRAGFRRVAARAAVLDHVWTPESYVTYKQVSRDRDLVESLDPETRTELLRDFRARLDAIAAARPHAFVFRPPIVTLLGRAA